MRLNFVATISLMWVVVLLVGIAIQAVTTSAAVRDAAVAGGLAWLLLRHAIQEL